MFLLLNCFASYAADEDKPITVIVTKAGTFASALPGRPSNIKNLRIVGEINGTDLRLIRRMARYRDENGDETGCNLSVLDLSKARIVEGGDYYINHYTTSDDTIGEYAFYECDLLESIKFPLNVTSIGKHAFSGCTSLTSVKIPSSVTEIGNGAFRGCISLQSANIPSSVTEIRDSVFYGCTSLTSVNIPSSVTNIGKYTFRNCTSLTSVKIPSSVTNIGKYAFSGCTSLTSVKIPSSVTEIGNGTFTGCTSLTSVNIPSSVTEIGEEPFSGCTSLTSINIPSSVTEIGWAAFEGCNSLKSIYVFTEDVPWTDLDTFKGCDSMNCILYVPKGTYDAYRSSEFGYFENIVEFDATSIHNTVATPEVQETARYAVNGQRLTAPIKGINLVKYSDGTVKKEFVK